MPNNNTATKLPVILSYGMGVDSTAILLRWLDDPTSRDFDLNDLTVVTAMTGDEFESTRTLVEKHIVPRLRAAGVRFVQVGRATGSTTDGVAVLSDSTATDRLYLEGAYKLSDELRTAGTVPQVAQGKRLCSIKAKGEPLDAWIEQEMAGQPFRHVMGFNADENRRVVRDCSYSTAQRNSEYPLVTWGWGRVACEQYIENLVGEPWAKSCCTFCPFAGGKAEHLVRIRNHPQAAADALMMEFVSLALNPRMTLYAGKSFRSCVAADGNQAALDAFETRLNQTRWAIYRVRRVYRAAGCANRSVETMTEGTRNEMLADLARRAAAAGTTMVEENGARVYLRVRGETYPAVEEMLVAGPAGVANKQIKFFETIWTNTLAKLGLSATSSIALASAEEALETEEVTVVVTSKARAVGGELNAKEAAILSTIRAAGRISIADTAQAAFPGEAPARANSWVRNGLRKLVREGHVAWVEDGVYEMVRQSARTAA